MLDGSRYFAEFPDEDPARQSPLSAEARNALAALEREISTFLSASAESASEGSTNTSAPRATRSA